jgi:hypothetical protein
MAATAWSALSAADVPGDRSELPELDFRNRVADFDDASDRFVAERNRCREGCSAANDPGVDVAGRD